MASADAAEILFNGKQYDVSLREFLDNAHCIFIPANSMGSRGIDVRGQRLTTTVEFIDQTYTGWPENLAVTVAGGK